MPSLNPDGFAAAEEVGMPRGTRGTRSPRSPAVFQIPGEQNVPSRPRRYSPRSPKSNFHTFFSFFSSQGHCYQSENNGGRGRANANQKDLNRNFPDQFHDGKDQASLLKGREPETLAAMKWIVSNPFILSGNLHGGSVVASYPFDDSPRASPWRSVYSKVVTICFNFLSFEIIHT